MGLQHLFFSDASPTQDEEPGPIPIFLATGAVASHRHTHESYGAYDCPTTGTDDGTATPQ